MTSRSPPPPLGHPPPHRTAVIGSNRSNSNNMNNNASSRRSRRMIRQPNQAAPRSSSSLSASSSGSDFCLSLMPRDKIVRRTLHAWSVHYSPAPTSKWVATIGRPYTTTRSSSSSSNHPNGNNNIRHVQFLFDTERQARKFCYSYAPPKMSTSLHCQMCVIPSSSSPSSSRAGSAASTCSSRHHCRNCGVTICESSSCSAKWGNRMVPKTYLPNNYSSCLVSSSSPSSSSSSSSSSNNNSSANMTYGANSNMAATATTPKRVVRVCKSCDWLSNAFCMALIQGRYQDALILHDTVRSLSIFCCLF
jgi:hypothetical protein